MIRVSAADYQFEARRDAAEIVLAGLLRDAAVADDAGDARVLNVRADAHPPLHSEIRAAVEHEAGMERVDIFTGLAEARRFFVPVPAAADRHIWLHSRRQLEPVAHGHLERRERRRQGDAQTELLA